MRALALLALTGCAVGAPPGFGAGESWAIPLVAPLEDDLLLVPVYIQQRPDPVLFMIDPDSAVSSLDNGLVEEIKPYARQVPNELNERDVRVPVFLAEIKQIRVGELEVNNLLMRVHKFGTFWAGGRQVRGILGRDVIADSLMFSADRDRGIVVVATQGSISPPPRATEISYRNFFRRHVAQVKVNGAHTFDMHIDLGARTSMLWGDRITKAKLPRLNVRAELQDEYGTTWHESWAGLAAIVEAGSARADAVVMLPYGDKRIDDQAQDIDGVLGQNFLAGFNVTVNWHQRTFWLKKRSGDLIGTSGERLRRWGKAFVGCERPACVQIQLVRGEGEPAATPGAATPGAATPGAGAATPGAGAAAPGPAANPPAPPSPATPATPAPGTSPATPPAPAPTAGGAALREIRINREERAADAAYEILLEAVSAEGRSLGLPRLRVSLPIGVETLSETKLAPEYGAAAAFFVLDASPFPRECDTVDGAARCVWKQSIR